VSEAEIELTVVPRRVSLDPRILLIYDFMRRNGYKGTLSDFIADCVIDAFRARGWDIIIGKTEEVKAN